jgi:uncharacterized membrane protein YfcA
VNLSWIEITVLIVSGLAVGFINTLAGGGSVISLSVLMLMGLPAPVANGTNRIAIAIQTLTATTVFRRKKVLDLRKGTLLGIPAVIGSLIGAYIAIDINEAVFEKAFAVIMLIMIVFVFYNPKKLIEGKQELVDKRVTIVQWILFFILGLYGGFVHVGIGYFLLAALILNAGYDLVKANAVKVFIVLMYIPFSFLIFLWMSDIRWAYGLIMAIGSVTGAYIASSMAVKKGIPFVKWTVAIISIFLAGHFLGIYDIKEWIGGILNK